MTFKMHYETALRSWLRAFTKNPKEPITINSKGTCCHKLPDFKIRISLKMPLTISSQVLLNIVLNNIFFHLTSSRHFDLLFTVVIFRPLSPSLLSFFLHFIVEWMWQIILNPRMRSIFQTFDQDLTLLWWYTFEGFPSPIYKTIHPSVPYVLLTNPLPIFPWWLVNRLPMK